MSQIVLASSGGIATASQVPGKYDLVIDGHGYIMLHTEDQRYSFSPQQGATFTYSPTFVQRQNVSGDYGDNQQDFFLTAAQRDWSAGEQLKYFRTGDIRESRYWQGQNVDVTTPGQVTLRHAILSASFAGSLVATTTRGQTANQNLVAASSTKLYEVSPSGAITDQGNHGLGAAPTRLGLASDGKNVYLSTSTAGTVGVRRWDGASFTTWSTSFADSLEYLNNTIYGFRSTDGTLVRYDSAGLQTALFPWKDGSNGARTGAAKIKAYGGDLLILWLEGPNGPELWTYDGTGVSILMQLPKNFYAYDLDVAFGQVFIGGSFVRASNGDPTSLILRPAVYFYASGSEGELWRANTELPAVTTLATAGHPAVIGYDAGLVFNDDTRGELMLYQAGIGGVHSIGTYPITGTSPALSASQRMLMHVRSNTTALIYPDTTTVVTSGYLQTSLYDFDSSLDKYFKSVKFDADIPAGASIDLAYQVNSLDSTYTTVQTSASPGVEYTIDDSGRSVSLQFTLNRGTSTAGPTLRRTNLRASPVLNTFRQRQYVLNLSGIGGGADPNPVWLRDGTEHPKTGHQMAQDLIVSVTSKVPLTITDEFGTFTGILEPSGFQLTEVTPLEYVGVVQVREV